MYIGNDYWKNYMVQWFGPELIEKWEKNVIIDSVASNSSRINVEVYATGDDSATTIVFAHGIAGYARVLLPFTMPLFAKGYNLVIPDLQGYGYNDGLKGDFEWNAHVQNLKDTVAYAQKRFNGKVILGGASMGGPLAYAAACESHNISGLICWCLWDFSDKEFMTKETNTKQFTYILMPIFKVMSKLMGKFRIKTYKLVSYDTLTDSQDFNEMVKNDPQAGTHITLNGAASLVLQSQPKVAHEDFQLPVLVCQPENDRMTPKYYIEKTFKKIGSSKKRYVEMTGAPHFPLEKKFYDQWATEVDNFIKDFIQ